MSARLDEDLVASLLADIHYYYSPPMTELPYYRFDKGSYIYLFEDISQRKARLEIANRVGTLNQDTFTGQLDETHVHYSYRHPCLLTLTVDGLSAQRYNSGINDTLEWNLPTFDSRNEKKELYKLNTLDIYFWTKKDAEKFLGGVRRLLPTQQITLEDEPVLSPPDIQILKNMAITDLSHQQGYRGSSRYTIISTSSHGSQTSAVQQSQDTNHSSRPAGSLSTLQPQPQLQPGQAPASFQPLAYNPAAPAAPEAIKHREKTPPPEDGARNPLVSAANTDQGQVYGVPYQYSGADFSEHLQSPQQRQFQFQHPRNSQNQFAATQISSAVPPPTYQAQAPSQPAPAEFYSSSLGLTSPGMGRHALSFPIASTPSSYRPVFTPPGKSVKHSHSPRPSNMKHLMTDASIHSQVYTPTQEEVAVTTKPKKPPTGKWETRVRVMERTVGGVLNMVEKRIG